MEIIGRLTADASVATTKSEQQVVNFSIAINDSFKPKGSDDFKEITTYVNCAYWLNAKAASRLKKGALVQLYGRIGMNVYNNSEGNAVGSLNYHVNDFKVLAFPKSNGTAPATTAPTVSQGNGETDDLPF
ncbi:MAG TPA: single-stranded DNA-binding protein [Mucilaginibacter sp.]|nr:single-stranded DNA-binding protein [Mucilaginibacter sp.]